MEAYVYIIAYDHHQHTQGEPLDMRLGVYSLQGLIAGSGCRVREGARYAFTDRTRTMLRMEWFDGTGLCMFTKRLERDTFSCPAKPKRKPAPKAAKEKKAPAKESRKPRKK